MIGLDIETTRDGRILGVGLAWWVGSEVVGAWLSVEEFGAWFETHPNEIFVLHNAKFDLDKLLEVGYNIKRFEDTYLMAHVLRRDQEVGSLGLKELALADLGMTWAGMEELGWPEDMEEGERARYCVNDAAGGLRLERLYYERIRGGKEEAAD